MADHQTDPKVLKQFDGLHALWLGLLRLLMTEQASRFALEHVLRSAGTIDAEALAAARAFVQQEMQPQFDQVTAAEASIAAARESGTTTDTDKALRALLAAFQGPPH